MNNQPNEKQDEEPNEELIIVGNSIFWALWVLALLIIPIYFFTFAFEVEKVQENNIGSYLAPVIGFIVLILQIALSVISYKQMKQKTSLSRPFLTLLGGTILIGFIWAGGCSIMGPWQL